MPLQYQIDAPLQNLNTFGLSARASRLLALSDLADLPALLADTAGQPVLWLGGGSNILLSGDYAGTVVRLALRGIRVLTEDEHSFTVEAAAGEVWHDFVLHCLSQGWYGLENLSLIPGTVGASPIQNIGAYGVEVKDVISEVVCADLHDGGREVVFSNADCRFAYRDSRFKQEPGRYLVTAVRFRLNRECQPRTAYGDIDKQLQVMGVSGTPTAEQISQAVIAIRQSKLPDPRELGNAGSFFKNPVIDATLAASLKQQFPDMPQYPAGEGKTKLAAGWLIDQAGLKGYRQGDAGVHARQALVLVNYGSASGADLLALARHVQATVQQRYGVALEAEPVVI